jgi:hypothetical protein
MILRAFACIFTTLLFFGVPGAFAQDAQPKESSTETKQNKIDLKIATLLNKFVLSFY